MERYRRIVEDEISRFDPWPPGPGDRGRQGGRHQVLAVDNDSRPGCFLLAGSGDPKRATHSGAGRIVRVTMRPLAMAERGFPGIRNSDPRLQRAALAGYVARIVDTDLPESGVTVRNPVALWGWLAAYAAAISTSTSYEGIRDGATSGRADKPTKVTTAAYTDALRRLWILDPFPAWLPQRNHLKRLGTAPRHHLVDPALAASILRLDQSRLLQGDAMLGPLFESLVG